MEDPDDDVPIFPLGWKPKETKKPIRRLRAFHGIREKRVPKPTRLDKALHMIQKGAAEVNLMRLGNETDMDDKLASLIKYVQLHQHVVSVELQASELEPFRIFIVPEIHLADHCWTQGTPLGISNGMPKALSAIAKLLRVRRIPFVGLTGTGLDDFDGRMIAAALEDAPPRVSMQPERLDLTQIDFAPALRDRLVAAGEKAGVCVLLSKLDGPALRRP